MPWLAMWVAAGVLVVIATMVWWRVPKRQANLVSLKIRDPKARADVEDNFRKTIGQLLGDAAVLIGLDSPITNHSWRNKRPIITSAGRGQF